MGLFKKSKKRGTDSADVEKPITSSSENPIHSTDKIYLKAMPLREISDLNLIRKEIEKGNILILRITPLASKSIEDVKQAVSELYDFAEGIGGDIARLGEERVVICPPKVRIWREKNTVKSEAVPTAA